jgi:hypothetical protein
MDVRRGNAREIGLDKKAKVGLLLARGERCEACGWAPPAVRTPNGRRDSMMELHHVLPSSYGGSRDPENLVLLCPNHHAVAHAAWPLQQDRPDRPRLPWRGPADRAAILSELREIDADPAAWRSRRQHALVRAIDED